MRYEVNIALPEQQVVEIATLDKSDDGPEVVEWVVLDNGVELYVDEEEFESLFGESWQDILAAESDA